MKDKTCSFSLGSVDTRMVEEMLSDIKKEKPAGMDNMDGRLLKVSAQHVAGTVTHIINQSIKYGICPKVWKEAKIIPLQKNAKVNLSGANSRPVSILPALAKIMEKIVFTQIQNYFNENELNTDFQHAYRDGYSTATAMTQLVDDCLMNIDRKKLVGSVMLDFSAAFDVIDHDILLEKLKAYGFASSSVSWITSYLHSRKQRVFFNGSLSEAKNVQYGIPQGSCLGPLLFTIYTNDLSLILEHVKVAIYADDTTLYMASSSVEDLGVTLNKELQQVAEWIRANRMVLNIAKTKCILMGSHHMLKSSPKLKIMVGGTEVEQVDEAKLLGITLDSHLSWSTHINNITKKMGRGLALIRRCAEFLTPESVIHVIQALVLSHLDYCPVIWGSAVRNKLRKLQITQNKAARLALNCRKRSNIVIMHEKLSWLMVEQRLHVNIIMFFRNIYKNKKPACLYDEIQFTIDRHSYSTRHVSMERCTVKMPRTNAMKRTVMYRAMTAWNSLPPAITMIEEKQKFKKHLKNHIRKNGTVL